MTALLNQFAANIASLAWWVPIPWAIGIVGLAIAIVAFRRTRYPAIRLRIRCLGYLQRPPEQDSHAYLVTEITSLGSDIFDLRAYLEVDTIFWVRKRRSRWLPKLPMTTTAKFAFKPARFPIKQTDPIPDPVKNGQVVRFELTDHEIQSVALRHRYWKLPSQRWPGRVRVAVYHSGDRKLLVRKSWWFRRTIRSFDYGSLAALRLPEEQLSERGQVSTSGAPDASQETPSK